MMLAPTEPAASAEWRTPTRRWQYAVGALALVASATMFFISRTGDNQTADAATAATAETDRPDRADVALDEPRRSVLDPEHIEIEPAVNMAEAVTPPNILASTVVSSTPPAPRAQRPKVQRPNPAGHARKVTVAPHRYRKLDPDGTIDPYR